MSVRFCFIKQENQEKGRNGRSVETEVPPKSLWPQLQGLERGKGLFLMEQEWEVYWERGWSWLQLYIGTCPLSFAL